MTRLASILAIALVGAVFLPTGAQAAFGINSFDVSFMDQDGTPAAAGSHPFAMTISLGANFSGEEVEGQLRDLFLEQDSGLLVDTTAYPRCTRAEFLAVDEGMNQCSLSTQVGISASAFDEPSKWITAPVFNLEPSSGALMSLGFRIAGAANVVADISLSPYPPYGPLIAVRDIPEAVELFGAKIQLRGHPPDPVHDELRGACGVYTATTAPGDIAGFEFASTGKSCPVQPNRKPLLTLPTYCGTPFSSFYEAISWEGDDDFGAAVTHDLKGTPMPFFGCHKLFFGPSIAVQPTTQAARSPTGLDLSIDVSDEGLTSAVGLAESTSRTVALALPKGMTAGASLASSSGACSEADFAKQNLGDTADDGCPESSKIGTLEVESPLIEEAIEGSVYRATPSNRPVDPRGRRGSAAAVQSSQAASAGGGADHPTALW